MAGEQYALSLELDPVLSTFKFYIVFTVGLLGVPPGVDVQLDAVPETLCYVIHIVFTALLRVGPQIPTPAVGAAPRPTWRRMQAREQERVRVSFFC